MKYARDIQVGDKANGHEYGWMVARKVRKDHMHIEVVFHTMFGEIIKVYWPGDQVDVI